MIQSGDVPIGRFTADGAYGARAVDEAGIAGDDPAPTIVISPRKPASHSKPPAPVLSWRDAAIRRIAEIGRHFWRPEAGAHPPARAENGMYLFKCINGGRYVAGR